MSEWSVSKQQKKKEARAARVPAWEKAANEAFLRSGAEFMMREKKGYARKGRLTLVVLCGIPGCGKSTLAAAMKKRGFKVVSQDALGSRQKCEAACFEHVKQGYKVVVDRCNHTHQQRELWIGLAKKAKADATTLVVHLDCGLKECKKRVLGRKDHATLPATQASCGIVERFQTDFEPVTQARAWRIGGKWSPDRLSAIVDDVGATSDQPPKDEPPPGKVEPKAAGPEVVHSEQTALDRLVDMGWSKALCKAALLDADGDEQAAVDLLLTKSAEDLGV